MTAGRPRLPIETKKLRGTDQPCRRAPRIRGQFDVPRMPRGLAREAVPYWRKYASILAKRGILLPSDIPALAHMCLVAARLYAAEKMLGNGLLIKNQKGDIVRNPAAMLVHQYTSAWLVYCRRFALTPSDRAGVTIAPPEGQSLAEQLNEMVKDARVVTDQGGGQEGNPAPTS